MWATQAWMLPSRAALDPAPAGGGGGGGFPPSGATTYADFIAGNYYGAGAVQAPTWFQTGGTIDATYGLWGASTLTTAADTAICAVNTTFYMEISDNGYTGNDVGEFCVWQSSSQNTTVTAGTLASALLYDGVDPSLDFFASIWNAGGVNKVAFRHTTTDRAVSINGNTLSGSSSNPTYTHFSRNTNWTAYFGGTPLGYYRKMVVYGVLSDSAMSTLTT